MAETDPDEFDRNKFRWEAGQALQGLSPERVVLFAARCAWRVWPLSLQWSLEWIDEHRAGQTAGLVVATLRGAALRGWKLRPDAAYAAAHAANIAATNIAAANAATNIAAANAAANIAAANAAAYASMAAANAYAATNAYSHASASASQAVEAASYAVYAVDDPSDRLMMLSSIREDLRLLRVNSLIEIPLSHSAMKGAEVLLVFRAMLNSSYPSLTVQQTGRWYSAMEAGQPPLQEMAAWLEDWWQKHPENKRRTSAIEQKPTSESPAPDRSEGAAPSKAKSLLRKRPDEPTPGPAPASEAPASGAPAADPGLETSVQDGEALAEAGAMEVRLESQAADSAPDGFERTPQDSVPIEAAAPAAGESSTDAPLVTSPPRVPAGRDDKDPSPFNDNDWNAPDAPLDPNAASTTEPTTVQDPEPAPEPPERIVRRVKNLHSTTAIVPDCEADELTRTAKECMLALRAFLVSPDTKAPLTVSVEAPWGGGKSSLLRHLQTTLEADGIPTVWFNPWKHEAGKTLWAAFALSFERQMAHGLPFWCRWWCNVKLNWMRLTSGEKRALFVKLSLWAVALVVVGWVARHGGEAVAAAAQEGAKEAPRTRTDTLQLFLKGVPWAGALLLLWRQAESFLGSPLKLDLPRLFANTGKHEGGVDDLHRFHEDFRRLIRVYGSVTCMKTLLLRFHHAWKDKMKCVPPAWHPLRVWNDCRYGLGRSRGNPRPQAESHFRKPGRVVVFIDDLDRCEAPKAADLLQSLHQMLNVTEDRPAPAARKTPSRGKETDKDSSKGKHTRQPPGVMCILGMDRDKVAAAVAAKHEKLLPYLEDADGKGRVPRAKAMDFGHEYLEKFIQLTLHLPGMHGDDRDGYLRAITGWTGKDEPAARPVPAVVPAPPSPAAPPPATGSAPGPSGEDEPLAPPPGQDSSPPVEPHMGELAGTPLPDFEVVDPVARAVALVLDDTAAVKERLRIVDEDLSDGHIAHRCALAAADALENNPRKLKQFVNLFRLRLYIFAALDVLDKDTLLPDTPDASTATVADGKLSAQHVAKLVALDLACPLKMSTARDHPERDLLKQVLACARDNPAVNALIEQDADLGPRHDLRHAPLKLYFQNFLAGEGGGGAKG